MDPWCSASKYLFAVIYSYLCGCTKVYFVNLINIKYKQYTYINKTTLENLQIYILSPPNPPWAHLSPPSVSVSGSLGFLQPSLSHN